jgi:hypothetical protein
MEANGWCGHGAGGTQVSRSAHESDESDMRRRCAERHFPRVGAEYDLTFCFYTGGGHLLNKSLESIGKGGRWGLTIALMISNKTTGTVTCCTVVHIITTFTLLCRRHQILRDVSLSTQSRKQHSWAPGVGVHLLHMG